MTLLDTQLEVQWRNNVREWYESKGYIWTRNGDFFTVLIQDVARGTKKEVNLICDYCNTPFSRIFSVWYSSYEKSPIKKDACPCCRGKKTKESNLLIYGTKSVMGVDKFKKKLRETNIKKYGVTSPLQNKDILAKVQKTNIERYGVPTPAKNKEIAEKTKQTNLDRYGSTTYLHSEEGSELIKNIILEKFGVVNVSQSDVIKAKKNTTMYKNGTTPTSSQQFHIHTLIGGKLNYPFGRSSLDIAFEDEKIYLEYDGGGHNLDVKLGIISQEDFDKKEQRRSFYLKDNGWREIRIISDKDKLPSDKIILDFVDIAKSFIIVDKWFSAHWNVDEDYIKVNYKYTYTIHEFFNKYKDKEAI